MRVIGAATVLLAVVAPAHPSGAADACNASAGVTVIVDFTYFQGAVERGCASGRPANALDALHDAGFATAGTTEYGDAFVCRIDDEPSPSTEACTATPPTTRSWSFYFARVGASAWTYSATGVLGYTPPPGSAVAFAFGNEARPGVAPPVATTTSTTTTSRVTVPPVGVASAPTTVPTPATPATTARAAPAVASTTLAPGPASAPAARPGHAARATTTPRTPGTTRAPRVVERSAARAVHDSTGTPTGTLVAGALFVVLAGSGALLARRAARRRAA